MFGGVSGCTINMVKKRKKYLSIVIGFLLGLAGPVTILFYLYVRQVEAPGPDLRMAVANIGGNEFYLEVADTPKSRAKGLGGSEGINPGQGMLFIFEQPDIECFWMLDVDFPIDILWFDKDKRLIHKIERLSPDTYPNSFCPFSPAQYVVELPAGDAAKHRLELGKGLSFR